MTTELKRKTIYHENEAQVPHEKVEMLVSALGEHRVKSVFVFSTSKNIDVTINGVMFRSAIDRAEELGFRLAAILAAVDRESFELHFDAEYA